ncbi:HPF/RaiA family ribosome-associated protein [Longispora sp. NPDC051575]|uniref:HPF/RaiA family ribosome-associated protein n=1 Tax=Longispora sp. NPDC051575 TaxID=3154943 RepID=UPI003449F87C
MQVHLHSDRNLDINAGLIERVEAELRVAVARFGDQITRVEIHVSDENAGKAGGLDKRCVVEARPAGQPPVAVTHHAASVYEACSGAVDRLVSMLDSKFGRSDDRKGGDSIRHLEVEEG